MKPGCSIRDRTAVGPPNLIRVTSISSLLVLLHNRTDYDPGMGVKSGARQELLCQAAIWACRCNELILASASLMSHWTWKRKPLSDQNLLGRNHLRPALTHPFSAALSKTHPPITPL